MKALGYTFRDRLLLTEALTHSSHANENGGRHNERLEFLGDAVLGYLAAEYLFETWRNRPEGELTRLRAAHVCEPNLAEAARRLGLGDELRVGRGERASGGHMRDSLLSDAFEAVLGAMLLDGGLEPCRALVRREIMERPVVQATRDAKTELQELVQAAGEPTPEYRLLSEEGPDHAKLFTSAVLVAGAERGRGSGKTKKLAEQNAALAALSSAGHCEK